jgi:hypothetical protein
MQPHAISGDLSHVAAIAAATELLTRLRTDFAFVGSVARAAWLGEPVGSGSIDLIAALSAEGRHQVPMMAANRGFIVDREDLEAAQELDLVPLRWPHDAGEVRIHVLIASNALYGTIVRDAVVASMGDLEFRVVLPEDYALFLMLADDRTFDEVVSLDSFDKEKFNRRLESIGLASKALV